MRTRQFKYLLEIRRHKSLSAAAKALEMFSQSLGTSIRSLEDELGFPLLSRTYRGVTLTEAGRDFAELSSVYFDNLKVIHQKYTTPSVDTAECFRFVAMPHVVSNIMPQAIANFHQHFPKIQLDMREISDMQHINEQLLASDAEIAFVTDAVINGQPLNIFPSQLIFVPLWPVQYVCLLPTAWAAGHIGAVSLSALSDHPMIITENAASRTFNQHLIAAGHFEGSIIIENSYFIIREMLHNGLGFFITTFDIQNMSHGFDWQLNDRLNCLPLSDNIRSQFGYVKRRNALLSHLATSFLQILLNS